MTSIFEIKKANKCLKEFDNLKVQSCILYNNKYMIASTQITSIEIFAFIAVLVLKLFSGKVLFINRIKKCTQIPGGNLFRLTGIKFNFSV